MNELKYLDKVIVKDPFYGDWKGTVVKYSCAFSLHYYYVIIQYSRFEMLNFLLGGRMKLVAEHEVMNNLVKVGK